MSFWPNRHQGQIGKLAHYRLARSEKGIGEREKFHGHCVSVCAIAANITEDGRLITGRGGKRFETGAQTVSLNQIKREREEKISFASSSSSSETRHARDVVLQYDYIWAFFPKSPSVSRMSRISDIPTSSESLSFLPFSSNRSQERLISFVRSAN